MSGTSPGLSDLLTELTQVRPLSLLSREITDGNSSAGQLPFRAVPAGFGLCWNLGSSAIATDLGGCCSARARTEHRRACGSEGRPCGGGPRRAGAVPAGRRVRGRGGGRVGVPAGPGGVGLLAGHGALVRVRAPRLAPVPGRGGGPLGPGVAGRGPRLRALAGPDPEAAAAAPPGQPATGGGEPGHGEASSGRDVLGGDPPARAGRDPCVL